MNLSKDCLGRDLNCFQKRKKFRDGFFRKVTVDNDSLRKISDPESDADSAKIKVWTK